MDAFFFYYAVSLLFIFVSKTTLIFSIGTIKYFV